MEYLFRSDKELLSDFGKKFQRARLSANLSQDKLSIQTGVSRTTITRLENGQNISLLHVIGLMREIGELEGFDKLMNNAHLLDPELEFKKEVKRRKRVKRNEHKS